MMTGNEYDIELEGLKRECIENWMSLLFNYRRSEYTTALNTSAFLQNNDHPVTSK